MKLLLKVLAIAVLLAGLCMLAFEAWGEDFEHLFNQEACAAWFAGMWPWAWAAAIGLLVVDLFLPVPATGARPRRGRDRPFTAVGRAVRFEI